MDGRGLFGQLRGGDILLMGFSTPSTGISRRSLPAHSRCARFCRWFSTPSTGISRRSLPAHRPVLAGCPRHATFRTCFPQGHVGREVQHLLQQRSNWSLLLMGLPVSRYGHSPMICTMISLCRGLLSNSASTICCHVPRSSFDLSKGTVSEGPMKEALT